MENFHIRLLFSPPYLFSNLHSEGRSLYISEIRCESQGHGLCGDDTNDKGRGSIYVTVGNGEIGNLDHGIERNKSQGK